MPGTAGTVIRSRFTRAAVIARELPLLVAPEEAGAKHVVPERAEEIVEENKTFFTETLKGWYGQESADKAKQSAEVKDPAGFDWKALSADVNQAEYGAYTMNPETAGIDWESIPPEKIKVVDLSKMKGKPLHEVGEYLIANYADKYDIPGIEYWKYATLHPDKVPAELKDGNYHFFFGSVLRGKVGFWDVPSADWGGSGFHRYAYWLTNDWYSDYRVVLLEK